MNKKNNKIDLVQINLVVRCKDNPYDYCDYYEKDDLKGHWHLKDSIINDICAKEYCI